MADDAKPDPERREYTPPEKGRGQRGRGPTAARRERMARALRLREDGASYDQIAKTTKVSRRQAWLDVQDALKEVTREPAEEVLKLELARLDMLFLTAMARVREDRNLKAIDTALRIMDRRSRYLGLDKPTTDEGTKAVSTLLERLINGSETADPTPEAPGLPDTLETTHEQQ